MGFNGRAFNTMRRDPMGYLRHKEVQVRGEKEERITQEEVQRVLKVEIGEMECSRVLQREYLS